MKKKNLIIVTLITIVTLLNVGAMYADEAQSQLIGEFQATVINVVISSNVNYTYNPNGTTPETIFTADHIEVNNNSTCPITVTAKEIALDSASIWKPALVEPSKFEDWSTLTVSQTNNNIAIGIKTITGNDWMEGYAESTNYSTDLLTPVDIGSIIPAGTVNIMPTVKAGTAIDTAKELKTNVLFVINIAE